MSNDDKIIFGFGFVIGGLMGMMLVLFGVLLVLAAKIGPEFLPDDDKCVNIVEAQP